jgi:arylamine N-acetyltransferase
LLQERGTFNSANVVTSKLRLQSQPVEDTGETAASPHGHYVEQTQSSPGARDQWVSEISVDSHGGVCYHNPTSAIHEAPSDNPRSNSVCASSPETISVISEVGTQQMDQIKQSLVSNAAAQRRFEAMAVKNMNAVPNQISSEMASEFLRLHWCWIHPMFMFVYRPAFTRKSILKLLPEHTLI